MKNFFAIASMLMLTLSVGAQSIEGVWMVDQEFADLINERVDKESIDVDMDLSFKESEVKVILICTVGSEDMNMKIEITFPGTYVMEGNHLTCDFDKEKVDFNIVDIKTEDPEMKEMLGDEASKQMVLSMVRNAVKKEMAPYTKEMGVLTDTYTSFDVKSVTETELTLSIAGGHEVTFTKKQ